MTDLETATLPSVGAPTLPQVFDSMAARLLGPQREDEPAGATAWSRDAVRLGVGLGLAALYGVAIGLRFGGVSLVTHAAGVACGFLAVAAVAVPSLAVALALIDAPIDADALRGATARSVAKAGIVLGGLAPAAALFVVTLEDAITVTIFGFAGLVLAGVVAATSFLAEMNGRLRTSQTVPHGTTLPLQAFLVFAAVLAVRVWWLTLPILTTGGPR